MKTVAFLAGARPNYMKVFPVWKTLAAQQLPLRQILIHSGQHYDEAMSDVFFRDFAVEKPTYFLGVGSGPHGLQTAKVMTALEELFLKDRPDLLMVVGEGIRPSVLMAGSSALDVAPTLLYLLGLPVARDMEGRVLTEILEPAFAREHPVTYIPSYEGVAVAPALPGTPLDLLPLLPEE